MPYLTTAMVTKVWSITQIDIDNYKFKGTPIYATSIPEVIISFNFTLLSTVIELQAFGTLPWMTPAKSAHYRANKNRLFVSAAVPEFTVSQYTFSNYGQFEKFALSHPKMTLETTRLGSCYGIEVITWVEIN